MMERDYLLALMTSAEMKNELLFGRVRLGSRIGLRVFSGAFLRCTRISRKKEGGEIPLYVMFSPKPSFRSLTFTQGGKQEEAVLKALKNALNIICLHLSDSLFDFVLNLTYDYATSNAKGNAIRAFGGLIGCLARVQPEKTLKKFLPYCVSQIEIELRHGASSIRTTSTHASVPSDTTLHWSK